MRQIIHTIRGLSAQAVEKDAARRFPNYETDSPTMDTGMIWNINIFKTTQTMETMTMDEASKAIHEVLANFSDKDQNQLMKSVLERIRFSREERIKVLEEQVGLLKDAIDQL